MEYRAMETRCEESVGFTLIELLIAMAIGVTIASLAVPAVVGSIESARVARCVGEVRALEGDIAAYQTANDEVLPNGLADIKRDTLRDPWGSQYQYLNFANVIGKTAMRKDRFLVPINSDYDLYRMGKDRQTLPPLTTTVGQDDIVRANDGGF